MKEGNYLVNLRVLEGSELIPKGSASYVNPFCVVYLLDQIRVTKVCKKTLAPLWDENFTFEFSDLKKQILETAKLKIEVYDRQYMVFNELIGTYEIDLTSIYYEKGHSFYMTWFTLTDPEDVREGCMGFVLMNIDVLGPDDKPVVREKITEDSVNQTVISKKIRPHGHLIIAEVYRAEHITPMNITKKGIDGVVRLNYGGVSVETNSVDSPAPIWNETLYLQAMLPNHSKNVQVELWNRNTAMQDDLIGTCLIPFASFQCLMDLPPMWVNIYGPPLSGVGNIAKEMAEHGFRRGSTYRGRVLIRWASQYEEHPRSRNVPMVFKAPEMLIPTPPTKAYVLRIDVFTGQELPGKEGMLHFQIGPYFRKTKMVRMVNGVFDWDKETVTFERVMLPVDAAQIPDLVVYFADQDFESHRKCYFRLHASKILNRTRKTYAKEVQVPTLIKFKEDQTLNLVEDDQFSGFAIIRPVLFAYEPPEPDPELTPKNRTVDYELRLFFYVGRNLPTAETRGSCNPLIVVRAANRIVFSTLPPTPVNTINPEWYEAHRIDISAMDHTIKDSPPLALVIMLYHIEPKSDDTMPTREELEELFSNRQEEKTTGNFNMKQLADKVTIKKQKVLLGRYWLDVDLSKTKKYKDPSGGKE